MGVQVTAAIKFSMGGKHYLPGDKLIVTKVQAKDLAVRGFIKSTPKPIIDKMIREPKKEK